MKREIVITFAVKWRDEKKKTLERCINSIKRQYSKSYEIILVDHSEKTRENAVKDIIVDKNCLYYFAGRELDCALLTDLMNKVHGEYLQIIDACDYISVDWLYYVEKTSESGADFIIGNQIYCDKHEALFDFNLSVFKSLSGKTKKADLIDLYYRHGGEDRCLVELNNKVIKKELMRGAAELLNNYKTEGAFFERTLSFVCFLYSGSIALMKNADYIYDILKENRIYSHNPEEVLQAFYCFIDVAESEKKVLGLILPEEWKEDCYLEIGNRLGKFHPSAITEIFKNIENVLGKPVRAKVGTSYFELLHTPISESSYKYLEKIKLFISSAKCEYVGFDIFDTLIERPFWEPTDLFYLLNDKFNELMGAKTSVDFSLMRRYGEQGCRRYWIGIRPSNEDVTIDEIYDYIGKFYGIDENICAELKAYEISLEKKYCSARAIGRELFDFAKYCGKKIVIVSDMYLTKNIIEEILRKNNFIGYQRLYLSNDIGLSKYSGRLFKFLLKNMVIDDPKTFCFIGDNYQVDVINSEKSGMIPFHVPKAVEIFSGANQAIYSGEFFKNIYKPNGSIIDQGTALKFIGIRCMMAVTANKFFGNPFVSVNKKSDFNADSSFVGYYCAGMFLFSEAMWLLMDSERHKIDTIHFVSRDGYFIKEAYDRLHALLKKGANSNYLFFSRKAVAPLYLKDKAGIYELFLPPHVAAQTPQSVLKLLHTVVKKDVDCENIIKKMGIIPYKTFADMNEYYLFADVFKKYLYDQNAADDYYEMLKEYFGNIVHRGDVIFDVGYSGRMETALGKLLGYPVNSYYFHEHEPWALMRKQNQGFSIDSFYSFKPCSAFVLREQIFTPAQPSCTGFEKTAEGIRPVFGEYHADFKEEYILKIIQNNSIAFIEDMISIFGDDLELLVFNRFDACIPFEYFIHYAKPFDSKIMYAIEFEDEFGSNSVISLVEYWEMEKEMYRLKQQYQNITPPAEREIEVRTIQPNMALLKQQIKDSIYEEEGIFRDGLFMKFYRKLNKIAPKESKKRNALKKIARLFVK